MNKPSSFAAAALLATFLVGCVSGPSEAERFLTAPRPAFNAAMLTGHAPPPTQIASDRDELVGILDSLHAHYTKGEKRLTLTSRFVAIGALLVGAVGASSSALVEGDRAERKLSQGASALTAILAGLTTEFQLSKRSEQRRACTATLYHALSDVRLRYSNATLPVSDSAWARYVVFKDSVDRGMRLACE